MWATLANVWHPLGGISITDLSNGRFLFHLFHKVDADRIEARGLRNFNSHLLVMHRLHDGKDPKLVPLNTVNF